MFIWQLTSNGGFAKRKCKKCVLMNSCLTKITTLINYSLLLVQKCVPEYTDSSVLVFLLTLDEHCQVSTFVLDKICNMYCHMFWHNLSANHRFDQCRQCVVDWSYWFCKSACLLYIVGSVYSLWGCLKIFLMIILQPDGWFIC